MNKNFKEQLSDIKAFVFDCDGVFTDGRVTVIPSGEHLRSYNVKDGYAVALAVKRGYPICIISGGVGESMHKRFSALGIKDIFLGCGDKIAALEEFSAKYNIPKEQMLYMGDDVPDIAPLREVGAATAPKDCALDLKNIVKYISPYEGGRGCVRDVIEQVLKAQGAWSTTVTDIYSR